MKMIAAEVLDMPDGDICLSEGDTAVTPVDFGCFASCTTFVLGRTVHDTALALREGILDRTAELFDLPRQELYAENAAVRSKADPDALIYPGRIPSLHEITLTKDSLRIGAMATMAELSRALAAVPEFAAIADAAGSVGSPQIRSKATLVGNLCNASPAILFYNGGAYLTTGGSAKRHGSCKKCRLYIFRLS